MAKQKREEPSAKATDRRAFRENGERQYLTTNQGLRTTTIRTLSRRVSEGRRSWKISIFARRLPTSTMNEFLSVSCMRVGPPPMGISKCTNRWPH